MPLDSMHKCIKCKELVHAVCTHHITDAPLGEENICTHCYKAADGNTVNNGAPSDSATDYSVAKKVTVRPKQRRLQKERKRKRANLVGYDRYNHRM